MEFWQSSLDTELSNKSETSNRSESEVKLSTWSTSVTYLRQTSSICRKTFPVCDVVRALLFWQFLTKWCCRVIASCLRHSGAAASTEALNDRKSFDDLGPDAEPSCCQLGIDDWNVPEVFDLAISPHLQFLLTASCRRTKSLFEADLLNLMAMHLSSRTEFSPKIEQLPLKIQFFNFELKSSCNCTMALPFVLLS